METLPDSFKSLVLEDHQRKANLRYQLKLQELELRRFMEQSPSAQEIMQHLPLIRDVLKSFESLSRFYPQYPNVETHPFNQSMLQDIHAYYLELRDDVELFLLNQLMSRDEELLILHKIISRYRMLLDYFESKLMSQLAPKSQDLSAFQQLIRQLSKTPPDEHFLNFSEYAAHRFEGMAWLCDLQECSDADLFQIYQSFYSPQVIRCIHALPALMVGKIDAACQVRGDTNSENLQQYAASCFRFFLRYQEVLEEITFHRLNRIHPNPLMKAYRNEFLESIDHHLYQKLHLALVSWEKLPLLGIHPLKMKIMNIFAWPHHRPCTPNSFLEFIALQINQNQMVVMNELISTLSTQEAIDLYVVGQTDSFKQLIQSLTLLGEGEIIQGLPPLCLEIRCYFHKMAEIILNWFSLLREHLQQYFSIAPISFHDSPKEFSLEIIQGLAQWIETQRAEEKHSANIEQLFTLIGCYQSL